MQAMSSEMKDSPVLRDTLMFVRKASSDILRHIFTALQGLPRNQLAVDISRRQRDLEELLQNPEVTAPLRSQQEGALFATVVSQKVQLSKQKVSVSQFEVAYSKILNEFQTELSVFLDQALSDPRELFLHEILVYDLKSPHTDVFQPRPRFALERALYSPHDYLNCDCCPSLTEKSKDTDVSTFDMLRKSINLDRTHLHLPSLRLRSSTNSISNLVR